MKGFRNFVLRGNVVDLAVAVVIGAAFGAVVTALVKDFITPLIAAIGGEPNFESLAFTVHKSKFSYGDFINAVLAFLILAAVIYFLVVLPVATLLARTKKTQEATERDCPECLSSIPIGATRCMYCTSTVPPVNTPPAA
jgi:large conductance mechanosensitive channel